jgi:hypothetical protein
LVSEQHLDFELKRHFRERGRLAKELPVYVACCERASNSMRFLSMELTCVLELRTAILDDVGEILNAHFDMKIPLFIRKLNEQGLEG